MLVIFGSNRRNRIMPVRCQRLTRRQGADAFHVEILLLGRRAWHRRPADRLRIPTKVRADVWSVVLEDVGAGWGQGILDKIGK